MMYILKIWGDLNVDNYGGSGNSHPAEDETLLKYAPAVIFKFIAVITEVV